MISALLNSGKYVIEPGLIEMHQSSLEWLSSTELWKQEVDFFQKLLDNYAAKGILPKDKKNVSHFQNLVTYYGGELIGALRKKIKNHEHNLAHMLKERQDEKEYYEVHNQLQEELGAFIKTYHSFKSEFFTFIEKKL